MARRTFALPVASLLPITWLIATVVVLKQHKVLLNALNQVLLLLLWLWLHQPYALLRGRLLLELLHLGKLLLQWWAIGLQLVYSSVPLSQDAFKVAPDSTF
jgi:hypothetical protein